MHRPPPRGPVTRYDFDAPGSVVGLLRRLGGCGVYVDEVELDVRFGPWRVRTPLDNVAGAEVGGPYAAWKVLGARLSLADRGLTFGTTTAAGACIRFHRPVPGLLPPGLPLRHPALTVTVHRPHLLVRRLRQHLGAALDIPE